MDSLSDQQLLCDYAERRSESAFAELVRRHIDLVYSAALRMVCDAHLAEDVAQGAFVALAQNARQLSDRPVLSGWLHRTAQNLAANVVRSDVRRRAREQEAAAMNELLSAESDVAWKKIAPHLDAALGDLSEVDRDALLLRYFERKSAHEIAQAFGISDEAAQKRVSRAEERLREFFSKRGVAIGAGGLVVVISANAVQAAPVALAATISSAAILAGTTISTSTAITATKAIAMTTIQKAIVTATVVVLAGGGVYEARQMSRLSDQAQILRERQAPLAAQVQQLQQERADATNRLAELESENAKLKSNQDKTELLTLRGEVAQYKATANDPITSKATDWLKRVGQLKQRLEESPGAKIPELQFVTEKDWLNAASGKLETDVDYRKALATLRNAGESKFAGILHTALEKYSEANNNQFPTELAQLQPYFDSAVDNTMLERWEIAPVKNNGLGGDSQITEKSTPDEMFDSRFNIGTHGYGSSSDFLSFEGRDLMGSVYKAFRAANNDRNPEDPSKLLPYATTAEQQSFIQKLIAQNALQKSTN